MQARTEIWKWLVLLLLGVALGVGIVYNRDAGNPAGTVVKQSLAVLAQGGTKSAPAAPSVPVTEAQTRAVPKTVVAGDGPVSAITGKKEVAVGKAAAYKTTGSAGKTYRWVVAPEKAEAWCYHTLFAKENGSLEFEPGLLLIPEEPCVVTLMLFMISDNQGAVGRLEVTCVGEGKKPDEPTPPKPDEPTPPKPDDNLDPLTKWTLDSVPKLVSLDPAARAATAGKLAEALQSVIAVVQATSELTTRDARELLAKQTYDALTEAERKAWDAWSQAMDKEVTTQYVTPGKLKTAKDYATLVWAPILAGLQRVSGGR